LEARDWVKAAFDRDEQIGSLMCGNTRRDGGQRYDFASLVGGGSPGGCVIDILIQQKSPRIVPISGSLRSGIAMAWRIIKHAYL